MINRRAAAVMEIDAPSSVAAEGGARILTTRAQVMDAFDVFATKMGIEAPELGMDAIKPVVLERMSKWRKRDRLNSPMSQFEAALVGVNEIRGMTHLSWPVLVFIEDVFRKLMWIVAEHDEAFLANRRAQRVVVPVRRKLKTA